MAGIIKKIASQDYVTTEASSIANNVVDVKLDSHVVSWDKIIDTPFSEQEDGVVTLNETYIPNTIARVSDLAAPKTELILTSTEDSTKNFKITINSSGVLTIEEILEKYSWEGVFASIDKGTYATDYAIGDCIPLDLGSEGVINMQIAAFDTDDLADGSGKAPITWIAKELLNTDNRMSPKLVTNSDGTYQDATGAIGGWEKTEMRTYLKGAIKPLMPEVVRNSIKEVTKTHDAYNTAGTKFTQTSSEDVWLPDYNEMFGSSSPYKAMFPDDNSRKKYKVGATSAYYWWLRSAYSTGSFYCVATGGKYGSDGAYNSCGVAVCFCT